VVEIEVVDVETKENEKEIINKVVLTVLRLEQIKHDIDVYVMLTNNEEIHRINKEQRDVDRPTDVLSFPMFERDEIPSLKEEKKDDIPEILGDIVISIPKVIEQANEYGHSYERELAYLTTHGMLHLLGYDHMIEEEKKIMREHEEKVMNELKIYRD